MRRTQQRHDELDDEGTSKDDRRATSTGRHDDLQQIDSDPPGSWALCDENIRIISKQSCGGVFFLDEPGRLESMHFLQRLHLELKVSATMHLPDAAVLLPGDLEETIV